MNTSLIRKTFFASPRPVFRSERSYARGGTLGSAFVVWDSLDDLSFGDPLKLGFSIIIR